MMLSQHGPLKKKKIMVLFLILYWALASYPTGKTGTAVYEVAGSHDNLPARACYKSLVPMLSRREIK